MRKLFALLVVPFLVLVGPAPRAAADDDVNNVEAVNTTDGTSIFRFALSVRHVANGVIDQTNTATARASCVDCETVAVAFQVILVSGGADVVVPENRAEAVNVECQECLTYAKATQLVIDIDGKELTNNGKRRLKDLERRMKDVEKNAANMSEAELLNAVAQGQAELKAIFDEELVPIGQGDGTTTTTSTTSTSTTAPPNSTTTTSTIRPTTSTTTETPTTTTAAP